MRGGSARATYRDALAGRKKVPTLRNGETRWLSTANGRLSDLRNDNRGGLRSNRLAEARRRASTLMGKQSDAILGDRWAW